MKMGVGETQDLFAGLATCVVDASVSSGLAEAPGQTESQPGRTHQTNKAEIRPDRACDRAADRNRSLQVAGGPAADSIRDSGAHLSRKAGKAGKASKAGNVDHLAAARRLNWQLRQAQSHSPEEVKAGRLICRHLLAMLDEALVDEPLLHQVHQRVHQQGHQQVHQNDSQYRLPQRSA